MGNSKKNGQTLESSIKILAEKTLRDFEENKEESSAYANENYHLFFNWDSWKFIYKKIA